MTRTHQYIGRFAPSPTGPLHFGSLVAALGSHTAARAAGGRWLVRIDDLDPPREQPGAADTILRQLEAHGLGWDGEVIYQSRRHEHYAEGIERLREQGIVYHCSCTRREIAEAAAAGPLGPVYPGTCRTGAQAAERDTALRFRLDARVLSLADSIQGPCTLEAEEAVGDVVVRRRDGLWAYHLANALDDAALGVTDVVRGADLLPAALVELAILESLKADVPAWHHLPIATGPGGTKLSKQSGARALDHANPVANLLTAWRFLGQRPPPEIPTSVAAFHAYARRAWSRRLVPRGPLPVPAIV